MTQITQKGCNPLLFVRMEFLQERNMAQLNWASEYLTKKGILHQLPQSTSELKNQLIQILIKSDEIWSYELLSKMKKAWNAHDKRRVSANSMLNVSISANHLKQFNKIVSNLNLTKIQTLEAIIDGSYSVFLQTKDNERKDKEARNTELMMIKKNKSFTDKKLKGEILQLKNHVNGYKTQISKLKNELQFIKDNSNQLFDIVTEVATSESGFTPKHLLEISKIHTLIDMTQLSVEAPILEDTPKTPSDT